MFKDIKTGIGRTIYIDMMHLTQNINMVSRCSFSMTQVKAQNTKQSCESFHQSGTSYDFSGI